VANLSGEPMRATVKFSTHHNAATNTSSQSHHDCVASSCRCADAPFSKCRRRSVVFNMNRNTCSLS
jgi:hypothetical protein